MRGAKASGEPITRADALRAARPKNSRRAAEAEADASDNLKRPLIFDDVSDVGEIVKALRKASGFTGSLAQCWQEERNADVKTVTPLMVVLAADIETWIALIENDMWPRTVCSGCGGNACSQTGWLPRGNAPVPVELRVAATA